MNACTNPDIILYYNRMCIATSHNAFPGIKCMICCVQSYTWPQQYIIPYCNKIPIQHDAIKISKEVVSYSDIKSKLTPEIGFEVNILPNAFQQIA